MSGTVLRPGETVPVVPQPGAEERRLRLLRRAMVPIVLIGGIVTGMWFQFIAAGVIVALITRRRIWQLTAQRLAAAERLATGWSPAAADLR